MKRLLVFFMLAAFIAAQPAAVHAEEQRWTADRPKGCHPCVQWTASGTVGDFTYTMTNYEAIDSSGSPGSYLDGSLARATRYAREDVSRALAMRGLPTESMYFTFEYVVIP